MLHLCRSSSKCCFYSTSQSAAPPDISYDFESEWMSASLDRMKSGHVCQCPGITDTMFSAMFAMAAPGGKPTAINMQDCKQFTVLSSLWACWEHKNDVQGFCTRYGVFSYISVAEGIRSAFCSYTTECVACKALEADAAFKARAARAMTKSKQPLPDMLKRLRQTAAKLMSTKELQLVVSDQRQVSLSAYIQNRVSNKSNKRLGDRVKALREAMQSKETDPDGGSVLVKLLSKAVDDGENPVCAFDFDNVTKGASTGTLAKHGAFNHFLRDCIRGMRDPKRRMSTSTKEFYATVINHGGPMLHNWVSTFMFGPALSTTMHYKVIIIA